MGRITLQQAAAWCGGEVDPKYNDVTFFGANIDTRKMEAGQLFVALQGVRDGHDFIDTAFEKGAAAVLCTHCNGDYPAIVVPDTRIALGDIARQERRRIGMKVVGVTGSVGKTTMKEMIASVLETMSYLGQRDIMTLYYETILTYQDMPDEDSIEMLEYVHDGLNYDFGYFYNPGSGFVTLTSRCKTNGSSASREYEMVEGAVRDALQKWASLDDK